MELDTVIIKTNLLEAMKSVHEEYLKETHTLNTNDCALCKLYRDMEISNCTICPMTTAFQRCGNRNCYPMDCDVSDTIKSSDAYKKYLQAVTMFYELAIIAVEKLSEVELRKSNFKFLKAIDKTVGKKVLNELINIE